MILVDTSVWIDHLRGGDTELASLLQIGQVLAHPWVIGELALGQLSRSSEILGLLRNLSQAKSATDIEVLTLTERHQLFGLGIGYVDAHLLAATMLTTGAVCGRETSDSRRSLRNADLPCLPDTRAGCRRDARCRPAPQVVGARHAVPRLRSTKQGRPVGDRLREAPG